MKDGHMGARKFWQQHLPVLKYHNPAIPMIINRHDQNDKHPLLTIYFRTKPVDDTTTTTTIQPATSHTNLSPAQPPAPHERTVAIDMKSKHSTNILAEFLAATSAVAVQPSKEDILEMQHFEALNRQSNLDRERVRQLMAEKKKEEDMLKRARAAGGMAEEEEE
ncbi:hypothetical protein E4U42_001607 [Claviceps africana]|uniref:Ribosomal protein/NADH dehydrogenase domain-containing protein n=1 Tax=Claviceps africana TaxID=83212 RepID=A0A8K0J9N5_9HYPO|nr:hypothetical protein E4U42_001607 [Claviceps africana]